MTSNPIRRQSDFASLLEAEIDTLEKFILILESEQHNLNQGQVDALPDIARRKSELLVNLSKLDQNRNSLFKSNAVVPTETSSLTHFFTQEDPGNQLRIRENWDKMLSMAKRAHELNQLNGAMIEALLKHNQQALAILHDSLKQNGLYGPDGHARSIGAGRPLGKI